MITETTGSGPSERSPPVGINDWRDDFDPQAEQNRQRASPYTDVANCRRLAAAFGDTTRWHQERGRWIVYDAAAGIWVEDVLGRVEAQAKALADQLWAEVPRARKDDVQTAVRHAVRSSSAAGIAAMIALSRSEVGVVVRSAELDEDPWQLNVTNGTVDLRTGQVHPHGPGLMLTKRCAAAYEPRAGCPLFLAFINRIMGDDKELVGYVRRLCGMFLTGDISEQILPLFVGVGANGKSVLVDTLLGIMGTYAAPAPPSLLTTRAGGDEHPTELADLAGLRLVVGSETEEGARLKVQLIKRLTGDRKVKARFMRQDYFTFDRAFKVLLVTNNKPVVSEAGHAIWRRMRLVLFGVVIPEKERDTQLIEKLRAEWPGILAWCVEGCIDWRTGGMRTPKSVRLATEAYEAEQDAIAEYTAARLVLGGPNVKVGRPELFADYQSWAHQVGERFPMSRNDLFERVRKLMGVTESKWRPVGLTVPVRGFRGVGLASTSAAPPLVDEQPAEQGDAYED